MNSATIKRARIVLGTSFVALSISGAAAIYFSWPNVSASIASSRTVVFVVVMACVSLTGYLLYVKQFEPKLIVINVDKLEPKFSAFYGPAIRFGILVQCTLGILTALMLDGGQALGIFKVAFAGHWIGIFLLLGRRPNSPTKTDIILIRWGTPLLMLVMGLIAPLVWKIIVESDLSGWQRLWSHFSHH